MTPSPPHIYTQFVDYLPFPRQDGPWEKRAVLTLSGAFEKQPVLSHLFNKNLLEVFMVVAIIMDFL